MKDLTNETLTVFIHENGKDRKEIIPVEVFRHGFHRNIDMKPRTVKCLHCGKDHLFPKQTYRRIWLEPMSNRFVVHFECPQNGCDGWLADFH